VTERLSALHGPHRVRPASIEHGAPWIGYAVDALKMLVTFALFAGVIGLMFQIGNQIIGRRK
jgi:hypothetical protein